MADETVGGEDAVHDQRMIGLALRALRLRAGLTQEQLAKRGATNPPYISLVENGHRGLRWHTAMRLVRAMGMTAGDLGAAVEEQERLAAAETRSK